MSVDEIQRIMSHLDRQDEKISKIQADIVRVLVTVADVPAVINKLNCQDTTIQLIKKDYDGIKAHCDSEQAEKNKNSTNWGSVKTNILVGTIMLLIGAAFTAWMTTK